MDGNGDFQSYFISHDLVHHPIDSQPFKIGSTSSSRKLPPSATRANTVTPMSKVSLVPQLLRVSLPTRRLRYAALNQNTQEDLRLNCLRNPPKKHSEAKNVRSLLDKILLNTYIQIHKRSCFFGVYHSFGGPKV